MRHCKKHTEISNKLGVDFSQKVEELYNQSMSGQEIADYIKQHTGHEITARSIQRTVKKLGIIRTVGDSFKLAIQRGRVHWAYKDYKYKRYKLSPKIRYGILKRDKFACVMCGNTAKNAILEVDHIVPICKGGQSISDNLQTLCHHCNKGKQIFEKEV